MLLLCFGMFLPAVWQEMGRAKLRLFGIGLLVTVLVITAMDIMWTPYILERYRMDIYFLMGIWCFTVIGFRYNAPEQKHWGIFSCIMVVLSVMTVLASFLLCAYRVGVYYPEKLINIANILHLAS